MVVCAVKLCRNYTGKNIKPPEGISFHRFPTDEDQKEEWIRAIRREPSWAPGTHCRVCSVHFDNSDFKISETGRRILHKDAVPTKNLYREEREDTGFSFKRKVVKKSRPRLKASEGEENACRACLAVHGGMLPLTDQLAGTFGELTEIQVSPTDSLPQHICVTCHTQLQKLAEFKGRCHAAQEMLYEATVQNHQITPEFLRSIDRRSHNLCLPLTIKRLPTIDITDLGIKEETTDYIEDNIDMSNNMDMSEMADVTHDSDFDIFVDRHEILTDDSLNLNEQKLFESDVKIEDNELILDHVDGKARLYGSIVPQHEIFVEDSDRLVKSERKRKSELKRKSKKIKKEREEQIVKKDPKEDVRNTKPRKTDEDYDNFAKNYNVDIVFLSKEEQIAEVEARKESDNYKNSRFKCDECFKGFTGEAAFNNHKAIHDPSVGNYVCEACHFRFPKRYKLLHHMTQHKTNFICRLCGHISKLASKAMEHFKWHNGVKYPCHYCDRIFIKRTSQFNHMRNRHGSAACDICQEIFSGQRGLLSHMQKAHKEAVKSRCEACGVQFHSETAFTRHLETLVDGQCNEYVKACAECGENYPSEEQLNDHMKMNHWKEIKCEKCNANFENEKLYRMHRVIHKETRNRKPRDPAAKKAGKVKKMKKPNKIQKRMCEMCGLTWRHYRMHRVIHKETRNRKPRDPAAKKAGKVKKMKKPNKIQKRMCEMCGLTWTHYRMHRVIHKETRNRKPRDPAAKKAGKVKKMKKPNKIQKRMCEMCGLTWTSSAALKYHQRVHTGEKPHQCPMCPKSFRIQDSLQIHMNTHTGARPFKCPHCPKAFKSRTQNHKHQLVHTKIRRYRCELCDKTFQTSTCVKTHIKTVHMKLPAPPRARRPPASHQIPQHGYLHHHITNEPPKENPA